jgi:sigma-B regulation protein RsbU (phosphoserine phosphatase)
MISATQPYRGETVNGDRLFVETGRQDGACLVLLVDVTHHGPATVPTMQALCNALNDAFYHDRRPADLLQWLHDALAPQNDITGNVVAAIAVWLGPQNSAVSAANAGQPEPLRGGTGGVWQLWTLPPGLFLGIIPGGTPYQEDTTPLVAGTCLLLFTDGVTEAGAKSNVPQFQHGALDAFLTARAAGETPANIVPDLCAALQSHVGATWPDDDTTLTCVQRL